MNWPVILARLIVRLAMAASDTTFGQLREQLPLALLAAKTAYVQEWRKTMKLFETRSDDPEVVFNLILADNVGNITRTLSLTKIERELSWVLNPDGASDRYYYEAGCS